MAKAPDTKHAMAFIDGQNLFQHAKEAFGHYHPNYDPIKLHKTICESRGWIPNLVRFYTGIPSSEESEMSAGYWANRLLQMKRSGVHVTKRQIRYRKQEITLPDGEVRIVTTPQEKGIDVRLALDVVKLARQNQYNVAVIYSQDQDLHEVVEEVKEIAKEKNRWIQLACAYPYGPNASSRRGIDKTEWIRIDQETYDSCLDPRDYRPSKYR